MFVCARNYHRKKRCYSLKILTEQYNAVVDNENLKRNIISDTVFSLSHVLVKLQKHFGNSIQIITMLKKKLVGPIEGFTITDDTFSDLEVLENVQRMAFFLMKKVLSIQKHHLPRKLEASHMIMGECEIPSELLVFLYSLICGSTTNL